MRFLIGHSKVSAAEKFLSFGCVRTEHRLVSAHINSIINVAWCFGHGILLDPAPPVRSGSPAHRAVARSTRPPWQERLPPSRAGPDPRARRYCAGLACRASTALPSPIDASG